MTSSRAGGGGVGGRDAGTNDSSAAGVGGAGGGAAGERSCSVTPNGCFCLQGQDTGQLSACNAISVVKNTGEQGICCDDGTLLCKCDAYVCKSTGSLCECGTTSTVNADIPSGTLSAACPAPTANQKCCLDVDTSGNALCFCSAADCAGATSVASCSITQVAVCATGQGQQVATCK